MFSDQLRKIDEAPHKSLLLVAAGLVIACQLVAMALVAGEQVHKAQMRGNSQASRDVAVASCVESSRGVAVKDCFRLGSSPLEPGQDTNPAESFVQYSVVPATAALDTLAPPAIPVTPALSAAAKRAIVPASFSVR